MSNTDAFIKAPVDIDFFISHPRIAQAITSPFVSVLVILLALYLLYVGLDYLRKKKNPVFLVFAVVSILVVIELQFLKPLVIQARTPSSSTVVAAIIHDKHIIGTGLFKQYYFVVDINREKIGVITTKDIYHMPMYSINAPFDYSLYTYTNNGRVRMYRFLKPDFKVKPEQGNCQ